MLRNLVKRIKSWSGWDKAGTIVKARVETFVGVLTAGIAGLAAFDWMPYFTGENINLKTLGIMAGYLVVSGILTEIIRRRGAKDLK